LPAQALQVSLFCLRPRLEPRFESGAKCTSRLVLFHFIH
jgi:hypothetical protein